MLTTRVLIARFSRYLVTGGIAAVVDAGGFALLVAERLAIMPAASISFGVAAIINYLLTSRFVYAREVSYRRFMMFACAALVGLLVNVSVTTMGVNQLALPPLLAKILGIGVAFLLNFASHNVVVFRQSD